MRTTGRNTNSSRTPSYGRTGHRIPIIFSLLVALGILTAYETRSKWWMRLLTRKCPNPKLCPMPGYHTHHLSPLGNWHYIYRYRLFNMLVPDSRPQPEPAGKWYADYRRDWEAEYNVPCRSCWVRDEKGYWVWVTDTPVFDRQWFDKQNWQYPAVWITAGSKEFYTVGTDELSDIVALEPQEPETIT